MPIPAGKWSDDKLLSHYITKKLSFYSHDLKVIEKLIILCRMKTMLKLTIFKEDYSAATGALTN